MKNYFSPIINSYLKLINTIEEKAKNCERNPQDISLVVASKGHSWSEVEPLYASGQRLFAESRIQELEGKIIEAPKDVVWHYMGPLQKNKVRKAISMSALIHSVDSLELARKIAKCSFEASLTTNILIQVNTSGERTKQGMTIEECKAACDEILNFPCIAIQGLMTIAPLTEDKTLIHSCFASLRKLQETLKECYGAQTFPHLSMGMSHDYLIAIEEGATLLRIGSAIFA
ncbi:MAG: YggS family pyridoxal phosphate-dependent enzyme [Parachlamydiaceae bacterium]|nr:YggS family pyridoxal phosphate-dependent enzyme [Parachlamydiaceae bacterium]